MDLSPWSSKHLITFSDIRLVAKAYGRALIEWIIRKYKGSHSILQVGTGDSPLTIPFYEKCGFVKSHTIKNFFIDNYEHPIIEGGIQLTDMVYLRMKL